MSAGWQQSFDLAEESEVMVFLNYNLTQNANYETDEFSQALFSVDGTLFGTPPADYLDQVVGNGNGGSARSTGWQTYQSVLGPFASGTHTVVIGGYNNKKTFADESTEILIDNVLITSMSGPGVIGLESSVISVNEPDGDATVTVLRQQGSHGTVTVDYRTIDGSAEAGSDYLAQTGTVVFADGETQKSVAVPITNDSLTEGNETFTFTIDNVTGGAILLVPRTATVTILDDETSLPNFTDFASATGISLNGDAVLAGGALRLTSAQNNQNGTAFFNAPLPVSETTSLQTSFQFQMTGGQGSGGADGLVFVLQNSAAGPAALIGSSTGGGLGYAGLGTSLAIEFDTYENADDVNDNHISILVNGTVSPAIQTRSAPVDLNSGNPINAWIDYNGNTNQLSVFATDVATKPASPLMTATIDLESLVGAQAYLGFTAATGGLNNNHEILNWQTSLDVPPTTSPPNPGAEIFEETIVTGLSVPTSVDWTPDGLNMYISEQGGVVKVYRNGSLLTTPFIDFSDQVNGTRDRGLLDLAVHPDFPSQPYVYLLYTYDPPEVFNFPSHPLAGPDRNGNRAGRLTRVTADAVTGYTTAVSGSESTILGTNSVWSNFNAFVNSTVDFNEPAAGILPNGTNIQDFIASDSESHTVGSLDFGPDGSLFVSIGDGTSYNQVDPRTVRVQDIDNLSGKVLRIDAITGEGFTDNPFFNGDTNANRSKVYQYGLRNPFRLDVDPVSGQVYIGDVGWGTWEEVNAAGPGANFGWPYFEGGNGTSDRTGGYQNLPEAQAFYNSGQTVTPSIFALNHAADGINAIVLGPVYAATEYPIEFHGDVFVNDLGQGIVRNLSFDTSGNLTNVQTFATGANIVVFIGLGPDGLLYYVDLDDGLIGRWSVA
jgi:glucose/arabinose dehydrogenase